MTYKLTPNQFHPETYDITVFVDEMPEVHMNIIHHEGHTDYWYGENADGFVQYGISHDIRDSFGHRPGYMWSSRASVFNGRFPTMCHCNEVTIIHNGDRYGYLAMAIPALIKLLSSDYELFAFVRDGEYRIAVGDAYQLFTDDQLASLGELVESFLCEGEVN